ncbi:MAG: hypothetical protein HFE49_07610 [Clostridia bacterium]|nr:hypothetical protein [Clostridia bacterium]
MKKQIISAMAALAMTVTSLPTLAFAADKSPEPVLRYTFDSKRALADENGKNELTLSGGASITNDGNTGKALLLDGINGYAMLPPDILTDNMTITAWVKINKFNTWGRLFDFGTDSNNNFFFAPFSGGASRVEIKTPTSVDTMDCAEETEKDWVHYAVTVDNGSVSYYRNGRLIKSKSGLSVKPADIKDELNYIGKSHYDGDAYLSASVDDFRVYDSALTRQEISDVMSDGNINSEILLKSYSIEDGQIITGDKINLPSTDGIYWRDYDESGLIDCETGKVKHSAQLKSVILEEICGDTSKLYTVYITGTDENPYTVNINAADRSKDISDIMWGLFFEDINSAADGGLYAEMVQNRSFEMDDHLYSWKTNGDVTVNTDNPLNENNPTYVTLGAGASITNDGFDGMSLKAGEKYNIKAYIRGDNDKTNHEHIHMWIDNDALDINEEYPEINLKYEDDKLDKDNWTKISGEFVSDKDINNAKLVISVAGGSIDIDMVSLIPEGTYNEHGLRKDLMEQLEAMHPKFLRFPGGCAVEGQTMDKAWNWKDTIGDVSERKEMINIWNPSATEPYMMTYGLGFYEYFQMCEDLMMEPVPILNCGIACQVRSGSATDEEHLVPMDELQPYIDDALDLIAFANGTDESNEWTKKRIEMGHPEPFNMKYIGIGNEQYGDIYFERYAEFAKQIHEKHPDINLVTTSGTASSGTMNDLAWNWANENTEYADLMDEHYYENPDWFRQHAYRYDNYRRDTNTKVFLGEYASKGNTWYNALSEAAFMTGLERNADVVRMASYAPMFAKYGNTQWSAANMIWFNNDDYVLTPNYYVQSLFSNNQGDYSLPTEIKMNSIEKDDTLHGGIVLGSWGTQNEFKDVTADYGDNVIDNIAPNDEAWIFGSGNWSVNDEGALVQSGDETGSTAWIDSPNTKVRTLSLKAKKTAGGEGFQIGVAAEDGQNYYRVNIGGWGNTTAKIQHIVDGVSAETGNVAEQSYVGNVHINDNEWYDVRVEVTDYEIKAYLNDEFICSYTKPHEYGPVYASSVYDEENGEVIVKLVNTLDNDVNIGVNIDGANVSHIAKTTVMAGDTSFENSLKNKNAITPKDGQITNAGNSFTYNAPANSLSIIHLSSDNNTVHTPYISGYTDGTFRPDSTITRAEAAAIIAKLAGIDENKTYANTFSDVSADAWYTNAVNFVKDKEYISGYENNTFKPENSITRAEFAVLIGKYLKKNSTARETFDDVSKTHFASGYISVLYDRGIIYGYDDKIFKPDNPITRAEAVTIMNRVLSRSINHIWDDLKNPFLDVSTNHWAYNEIIEASIAH